jgi:hypothetical protein
MTLHRAVDAHDAPLDPQSVPDLYRRLININ